MKNNLIIKFINLKNQPKKPKTGRCPRGIIVKALECRIVVSKFKFQLRYYIHFWTNTLGKGMNPLILSAMG